MTDPLPLWHIRMESEGVIHILRLYAPNSAIALLNAAELTRPDATLLSIMKVRDQWED